jgi:hypothetical protein
MDIPRKHQRPPILSVRRAQHHENLIIAGPKNRLNPMIRGRLWIHTKEPRQGILSPNRNAKLFRIIHRHHNRKHRSIDSYRTPPDLWLWWPSARPIIITRLGILVVVAVQGKAHGAAPLSFITQHLPFFTPRDTLPSRHHLSLFFLSFQLLQIKPPFPIHHVPLRRSSPARLRW